MRREAAGGRQLRPRLGVRGAAFGSCGTGSREPARVERARAAAGSLWPVSLRTGSFLPRSSGGSRSRSRRRASRRRFPAGLFGYALFVDRLACGAFLRTRFLERAPASAACSSAGRCLRRLRLSSCGLGAASAAPTCPAGGWAAPFLAPISCGGAGLGGGFFPGSSSNRSSSSRLVVEEERIRSNGRLAQHCGGLRRFTVALGGWPMHRPARLRLGTAPLAALWRRAAGPSSCRADAAAASRRRLRCAPCLGSLSCCRRGCWPGAPPRRDAAFPFAPPLPLRFALIRLAGRAAASVRVRSSDCFLLHGHSVRVQRRCSAAPCQLPFSVAHSSSIWNWRSKRLLARRRRGS